jgi:hypothetical protein
MEEEATIAGTQRKTSNGKRVALATPLALLNGVPSPQPRLVTLLPPSWRLWNQPSSLLPVLMKKPPNWQTATMATPRLLATTTLVTMTKSTTLPTLLHVSRTTPGLGLDAARSRRRSESVKFSAMFAPAESNSARATPEAPLIPSSLYPIRRTCKESQSHRSGGLR